MSQLTRRSIAPAVVLVAAVVLGGCGAHRARRSLATDPASRLLSGYAATDALNRRIEHQRALARVRFLEETCPPKTSARARLDALREARKLLEHAKTAPASEQAAIERRARELLERLDGF